MFATKTRLVAAAALAGALYAGSAQAGSVSWSVGIQAPVGPGVSVGTVISGGYPAPVVYAPAPVIYAPPPAIYAPPPPVVVPAPVVYTPPPVVYRPAPVVVAPAPVYVPRRVVYAPVWVGGRWVHPDDYRRRHHHHDGWRDGRGRWDGDDRRGPPVYQPHGGWGRDPR